MYILTVPIRIIYLFLTFIIGGISREYYYNRRGHYFADLKMFNFAIGDFKKALELLNDPNTEATLGWCYSQINELDSSLNYYRKAYSKSKDPEIVLGLAYAEYYNGNVDDSKVLVDRLLLAHRDDADVLSNILKYHEETKKWNKKTKANQ